MKVSKVDLSSTNIFSSLFLNYIRQECDITSFQSYSPDLGGITQKIKDFAFDDNKRIILKKTIEDQYDGLAATSLVIENIASLAHPDTYTVTTGHQLNIFTGPLYFIYKIISTIKLAERLQKEFPNKRFVPLYWMASEDHDYEEINHIYLFNKKLVWNTSQKGAVGGFETSGILELLSDVQEALPIFEEAYKTSPTLAVATRVVVNALFGKYGLVVLDPNTAPLKRLFGSIIKEELIAQPTFRIVNKTISTLENLGYKTQASPREINLFYLDHQVRERIIEHQGVYKINNTDLTFTKEEILKLVDKCAEKFSPNVLLRPVYQETILPNLAYVGGPAEVVYWLQLKELFSHFRVQFPVIVPRCFVLYFGKSISKKLQKLQLQADDLFLKDEELKTKFLTATSGESFSLSDEVTMLDKAFETISSKAGKVDNSLVGYVMAEKQKVFKSLQEIAKRLKKSEEKKNSEEIQQLDALKQKLFPNNTPQERVDNFLNFYINDAAFIEKLYESLDPLDYRFNILEDGMEV